MGKFTVRAPNGDTYDVDGPATQAEAIAFVQQQVRDEQAAQQRTQFARDDFRRMETRDAERIAQQADADAYRLGSGGQPGYLEQVAGGAKNAWDKAALGLKGLFTDLSDEDRALLKQGRAFVETTGPASTIGQIAGDIAITAPIASAAAAGAGALGAARAAAPLARGLDRARKAAMGNLAGRAAIAATEAAPVLAGNAALGAVMSPEDRAEGAKWGALGAGAGMAVNRAAGGLLKPLMTREAEALASTGRTVPTLGQALGDFTNTTEQKLTSIPLVGDVIAAARSRNLQDFNRDLALDAAKHLPKPVRDGVARAATQDEALHLLRAGIGDQYEAALSGVKAIKLDTEGVARAAREALEDPSLMLSNESKLRIAEYVQKNLLDRQGLLTGEGAKRIESDLGKAAQRFTSSAIGEERAMGQAMRAVHAAWRDSLTGTVDHLSPGAGKALREADAAYRAMLPLDDAAAGAAAQQRGGAATPRMLRNAMAALDKSKNDRARRAKQQMPDWQLPLNVRGGGSPYDTVASRVSAGVKTLGDNYPDSGTAARIAWGVGAGGSAAALGALPQVLGAAGVTAALYSKAGTRLLLMGIAPDASAKVLRWAASKGIPENVIMDAMPQFLAAYERQTAQPQQQGATQ